MTRFGYYLIGVGALILLVLTNFGTWKIKELMTEKETQVKINAAYADARAQVEKEHDLFVQWQRFADNRFGALEKQVAVLTYSGQQRSYGILKEIQDNPGFYNQKLPDTGYQLWLSAHRSFSSPASASSAASATPSATSGPKTKPSSH